MDQHLTIGFPVLFNIKQAIESGKQNEDSSFNAVLISGILNTGIEMVEGNYLQRTFIWKRYVFMECFALLKMAALLYVAAAFVLSLTT